MEEKVKELLERWRKDLIYLDSIKLTEMGESSRYTLSKCIHDLESL